MATFQDKFAALIEDFKKDEKKESDGVWMPYRRHEFLIARAHRDNKSFLKLMEERMRPYQWAIDRGDFSALKDVATGVMQGVYSETILKGIRDTATKESLDYNAEDGVSLFKQLPDFWDEVFKFSNAGQNYAPDAVKLDSGN